MFLKFKKYTFVLAFISSLAACGEIESNQNATSLEALNDITGPDVNGNGVRDDVDAYINRTYLADPQKAAALQMARVFQKEMLVSKVDKTALRAVAIAQHRAISCIYLKFDGNSLDKPAGVVGSLESLTANTKGRRLAYLAFSKAMDGTTSSLPHGDTCE